MKSEEFWSLSYPEILAQMDANRKIKLDLLKEQATMDYKRAQLMAYSVNDPKKMPKIEEFYPFMKEEPRQMSQEEASHQAMIKDQDYLRMRAQQIKATRLMKESMSKNN